jgi:hypothetical protein
MTNTVLSITPFRDIHGLNISSKNGRNFIIDIYQGKEENFDSEVTVLDNISTSKGSWLYKMSPVSSSSSDNFKASIEFILKYLSSVDNTDSISDIHNLCNCPFVSEVEQNNILSKLGQKINVRVN